MRFSTCLGLGTAACFFGATFFGAAFFTLAFSGPLFLAATFFGAALVIGAFFAAAFLGAAFLEAAFLPFNAALTDTFPLLNRCTVAFSLSRAGHDAGIKVRLFLPVLRLLPMFS